MPANVAGYFNRNLAEEQNLLTRKYEFQLFQFKHLYKHHTNDEKSYKMVCKQIEKNLSEFKKCASYLKLPKSALLARSTPLTPRTVTTPIQSQRTAKVQPHLNELPYLPSPTGTSFSASGMDSMQRNPRPDSNSQDTNMSRASSSLNASMCSQSSSQSNRTTHCKKIQYQSQSPRPHSHLSNARTSPQCTAQGRRGSNGGLQRHNHGFQEYRALHRPESQTSLISANTSLNDSKSSIWSHTSNRSRALPPERIRMNQPGKYGCEPVDHRTRCTAPQEIHKTGQRPNGRPPAQKTNLLQMQRALVNPRPTYQNQNSMRQSMTRNGERSSSNSQNGGNKQYTTSPFIKYRVKPQSPALPNTPLSLTSHPSRALPNTPLSCASHPSPKGEYRLVSPRTSSSLSSSNSHNRQEVPYKRPSGSELKTRQQNFPVHNQATPAPFQQTLKLLTAAVKKSNIR